MQDGRCPNNTLPAHHSSKQPCGHPSPSTQPESHKDRQGTQSGKGWAVPGELPAPGAVQSLKQELGHLLDGVGLLHQQDAGEALPGIAQDLRRWCEEEKLWEITGIRGYIKDQSPVNWANFKRHHNAFWRQTLPWMSHSLDQQEMQGSCRFSLVFCYIRGLKYFIILKETGFRSWR